MIKKRQFNLGKTIIFTVAPFSKGDLGRLLHRIRLFSIVFNSEIKLSCGKSDSLGEKLIPKYRMLPARLFKFTIEREKCGFCPIY